MNRRGFLISAAAFAAVPSRVGLAQIPRRFRGFTFVHQGGNQDLSTPEYAVDIALRVKRIH